MADSPIIQVSRSLQKIAAEIDRMLAEAADGKVLFTLLVWQDGQVQYVSNAVRVDVTKAMQELLAGWASGAGGPPPHERH